MKIIGVPMLAFVLIALTSSACGAKDLSEQTVAEWRAVNAQITDTDLHYAAYASGAVTAIGWMFKCPAKYSVAEMDAFLRYTADPEDKMMLAMLRFFRNRNCTFRH